MQVGVSNQVARVLGGLSGSYFEFTGVELDKLKNIMLPTAEFARKRAK